MEENTTETKAEVTETKAEKTEETEKVKEQQEKKTEEKKTFTQEELDDVVTKRVSREKAKLAEAEAEKSKLQKQIDDMHHTEEIRSAREKVSTESGIPTSLLTYDSEEDCRKQANAILDFVKSKTESMGYLKDAGEKRVTGKATTRQQFAEWINKNIK